MVPRGSTVVWSKTLRGLRSLSRQHKPITNRDRWRRPLSTPTEGKKVLYCSHVSVSVGDIRVLRFETTVVGSEVPHPRFSFKLFSNH